MNALDLLRRRGFVQDVTNEEGLAKALAEGPLSYYVGFDPTASSLHVGSLIPIMAMAHLQRQGHRPIAIVGGGTGHIGDPSGKTAERRLMEKAEIESNLDKLREQIGRFVRLGDGADDGVVLNNADWLMSLGYIDFLREIGRHFRVNVMIKAEGYRQRLERETGLSFLEFNYQVLQAYDFLVLNQRHGCRLQMGGSDQWGNICAGVDLIRRVESRECFGITFPLLTTASGQKMGKTESGAIWLDAARTSPYEYFQFWRNTEDADVGRFLNLFTFVDLEEIESLTLDADAAKLNATKERLALEATRLLHGADAADEALKSAQALFSGGEAGELSADALAAMPSAEVNEAELADGLGLLAACVRVGLAKSNGEARRLCRGGGLRVWGEAVKDERHTLGPDDVRDGMVLLAAGKKRKARLVLNGG